MFLDGDKIELHDNCVLIIPPFKRQERHVQMEELDYTFLIFQEEFVYNFISDKYFMYMLSKREPALLRYGCGANGFFPCAAPKDEVGTIVACR